MTSHPINLASDIDAWYHTGDRAAGARLLEAISHRVALPSSLGRALGEELSEEVEQDALVRLLDRNRRLLLGVDDPVAYAATVARNLARDALRRRRRRSDLAEQQLLENEGSPVVNAHEESGAQLDAERALTLLSSLGEDARIAVFLTHAPGRMPEDDWVLLAARQASGGAVPRPNGPLNRDEVSRLLWPPPIPETRPARRRRLERVRKVLFRAYAQLAAALGAR